MGLEKIQSRIDHNAVENIRFIEILHHSHLADAPDTGTHRTRGEARGLESFISGRFTLVPGLPPLNELSPLRLQLRMVQDLSFRELL